MGQDWADLRGPSIPPAPSALGPRERPDRVVECPECIPEPGVALSDVVDRFYRALSHADGDTMAACYADDVVFEDPAFGELHGEDARDMWRMLCANAGDLVIDFTVLESSPRTATVHWIASYTFSTGRAVVNDITAHLQVVDDRIVDHRDHFDLWRWSTQALGMTGRLLGWAPPVRARVRRTARANLRRFQSTSS